MTALSHRVAMGRRFGIRAMRGDAFFVTGSVGVDRLPFTVSDGVEKGLSGVNNFVLLQVMKDRGLSDPRFFTSNQIQKEGWSVSADAKEIGLQFLVSTDSKGLPLESPRCIVFNVFNASDIDGVPEPSSSIKPQREDVESVVIAAGFSLNDGLPNAYNRWLDSVQPKMFESLNDDSVELRSRLAMSLLEIQFGMPLVSSLNLPMSPGCIALVNENPLSFSHASNDALKLVAFVLREVDLARLERESSLQIEARKAKTIPNNEIRLDRNSLDAIASHTSQKSYSVEIEALFANRAAVLNVPFADKDEAKALGALWFAHESVWFVPERLDVSLFAKWEPSAVRLSPIASRESVVEAFRGVIANLGLDSTVDIKDDGKWHNVAVEKNGSLKGNKSGSYIFSMDGGRYGQPIGTVLNKVTGESFTWTTHKTGSLTPQQRVQRQTELAERAAATALAVERSQNEAASHAIEIWNSGVSAVGHGYVCKKGISPFGMRQIDGSVLLKYNEFISESGSSCILSDEKYLLVPMTNCNGDIRAVQAINSDGSVKSFMRGAQKKGTMFVLGADSFNDVVNSNTSFVSYVEGAATGASFYEAVQVPVVVCFDAGNLETVFTETVGKIRACTTPVLAIDNDQFFAEKGLGYLSDKLGVNPHAPGSSLSVHSGPFTVRDVPLGEAVADGQWHQAAKGTYCISLNRVNGDSEVESLAIDVVPDSGRKTTVKFVNRGLAAGLACLDAPMSPELHNSVVIVAPIFESLVGRPTDWNDLAQREGIESVQAVLRGQGLSPMTRPLEVSGESPSLVKSLSR